MNRTFMLFSLLTPLAARWSTFSFPVIPLCPFTHSNDVTPALFLSLFTIGFRRFVCVIWMKSMSVCLLMLLHRAFMVQSESI